MECVAVLNGELGLYDESIATTRANIAQERSNLGDYQTAIEEFQKQLGKAQPKVLRFPWYFWMVFFSQKNPVCLLFLISQASYKIINCIRIDLFPPQYLLSNRNFYQNLQNHWTPGSSYNTSKYRSTKKQFRRLSNSNWRVPKSAR